MVQAKNKTPLVGDMAAGLAKGFGSGFSRRFDQALDGRRQTLVAKKIGYSPGVISKYLAGNAPESFRLLANLAKSYNINLHWLLTSEGVPFITK
jgi:transcriptional regulator with XRE-family HTH domain